MMETEALVKGARPRAQSQQIEAGDALARSSPASSPAKKERPTSASAACDIPVAPLHLEEPPTRAKDARPRFVSWRKLGLCIVVFPWSLIIAAVYVIKLLYKEAQDQPVTVMGLTGIGIASVSIFLTAFVLCVGKKLDRMAQTRRLRLMLASRIASLTRQTSASPRDRTSAPRPSSLARSLRR